ncbi:MAG: glycosyltransferase [Patescibacteria group bacterium]
MNKILILSHYYPPYIKGGAEISTALLAQQLTKVCEVTVATTRFTNDIWRHDGIIVRPVFTDPEQPATNPVQTLRHYLDMFSYHLTNWYQTRTLIRDINPDCVICVFGSHYFFPCIVAAITTGRPILIDVRDYTLFPLTNANRSPLRFLIYQYERTVSWLYRSFIRWYSWRSNNVVFIALSNFLGRKLTEQGFPPKRIHVIPNIAQEFHSLKNEKRRPYQIIFAGRLTEEKGVLDAIQAVQLLPELPITLLIVGDGPELPKLREYVTQHNLSRIIFLGKKPNTEVLQLYAESKLIIAPSVWPEPFGRFIQESFATLTPCIATRSGGISEGITHGRTGLLVKPGDPQELSNAIKRLLKDTDLYTQIVRNLKNERSTFSPKKITKQRLQIIKDLL